MIQLERAEPLLFAYTTRPVVSPKQFRTAPLKVADRVEQEAGIT